VDWNKITSVIYTILCIKETYEEKMGYQQFELKWHIRRQVQGMSWSYLVTEIMPIVMWLVILVLLLVNFNIDYDIVRSTMWDTVYSF